MSAEDIIDFWLALTVSVTYQEGLAIKSSHIYDFRLLHVLLQECTRSWTSQEKLELDGQIRNMLEPQGIVVGFIQFLRNIFK